MSAMVRANGHGSVAAHTGNRPGEMTREQIELIKRTIAKGCTDDELALFIQTSKRHGLDPFARQIFAVKRWDSKERREVMAVQVSIDGFRLIAERTGEYQGQAAPQWCGADGVWREVWLDKDPPAAARIGVFRAGFREPLFRVARFDSYAQTTKDGGLTRMWRQMPDVMISKCAESLALRAAFPNDLAGLYTPDEMDRAIDVDGEDVTAKHDEPSGETSCGAGEGSCGEAAPADEVTAFRRQALAALAAPAPAARKPLPKLADAHTREALAEWIAVAGRKAYGLRADETREKVRAQACAVALAESLSDEDADIYVADVLGALTDESKG